MKMFYDDWYDLSTLREKIARKTNGTFSINEMIRVNTERYPDNIFINSFGNKLSWREAEGKMNRLADSFVRLGIAKGDKVSLLCGDSEPFVLTYLSVIRSGGVTVPINTRLATAADEIEYIVGHSESKIIVLEEKYLPVLEQIRNNLPELKEVVVIGEQTPPRTLAWQELLERGSTAERKVQAGGDEQALQLYTSGTTGRPKGSMLSHFNCLAQMEQMSHTAAYVPEDRVQNMLPFPHCGFICFSLSAFYAGAGLNIVYPFEPAKCAGFASEQKTTVLVFVPAMAIALVNLPDIKSYDLSSVRLFMYGAAPMPHAIIVKMKELWPWAKLQNIFGMTECAAAITTMKDEDALAKIGGVGRTVPGGRIRIVDSNDTDVPVGETGEIIYQGPNVMLGYFKNPEATEEVTRGGWYHTGDLGVLDEDGVLKVVDRKKDMLIRGGENVYPAEVERVLYEHPAVLECAVIGVPEKRLGERTKAFITLKEGCDLTPEEIINFCKGRLALYKVPEVIEFVAEIPKTPFGKLNKIKLRTWPCDNEYRAWEHR